MIKIIKRSFPLSDGSKGFDVVLRDEAADGRTQATIELHACSELEAEYLMEALRAAIVNYTVDEVTSIDPDWSTPTSQT